MNKGTASTMQLNVRAVQEPCILAYGFLPGIVLWVICCGGCGCPERYTYGSGGTGGDATDILIAIDQTGFPDQWATSPSVELFHEPQKKLTYVIFYVKNLGCQKGFVYISFSIHVGDPRVRSYRISSLPYVCPDLPSYDYHNFSDVADADIQCEIASTWDKENLVMSISIDYCEIEVLDIDFWGEGNTPSIQHISIHGTHTFQVERFNCR